VAKSSVYLPIVISNGWGYSEDIKHNKGNESMATLKETVRNLINNNRSGAIALHQVSPKGTKALSWDSFGEALAELNIIDSDFWFDFDNGVIHPRTEKGWESLEVIWANPNSGFRLEPNTQNAAFAKYLFKGLIDVQYDSAKIKKEKYQDSLSRELAGYGKGRWE